MKKILFVLLAAIGVFIMSCNSTPSEKPTGQFKETDTVLVDVYDSVPVYKNGVAHNEWKVAKKVYPVVDRVTISANWGQAFYYAFKYGYTLVFALGFALVLLAVGLFTLDQFDKLEPLLKLKTPINSYVKIVIFFVILAAGAVVIDNKPGRIRFDNNKKVDKAYYERVGAQHIWDSLENHNLIIGASH